MRCVGSGVAAILLAAMLLASPGRALADLDTDDVALVDRTDEDTDDDELDSSERADGVLSEGASALGMANGWSWPAPLLSAGRPLAGEMAVDWPSRLLLFSSTDLWRHGAFSHTGILWSPGWLDREGFVLKLVFGGGTYRYRSGALGNAEVMGRHLSVAILPGMRFIRGPVTIAGYAGIEYQDHRLTPDDPSAGLRGAYLGLRFAFDLWYQPTDRLMVTADASISSIAVSYSARIAGGYRVFDLVYVGPEVQAFAGGNYRQFRFGAHATGLRTGHLEWSMGMGWARDNDARDGIYGKLGMLARY